MKLLSHSLDIMSALSDGPKFAYELAGPTHRVSNRVRDVNVYYARIGSHWRIRGTWVHVPDSSGVRWRELLYRMVLES